MSKSGWCWQCKNNGGKKEEVYVKTYHESIGDLETLVIGRYKLVLVDVVGEQCGCEEPPCGLIV